MKKILDKFETEKIKNFGKFIDTGSSNTTIILGFFALVFFITSYLFFKEHKAKLLEQKVTAYHLNINYLNSKLEENILNHNVSQIEKELQSLYKTGLFESMVLQNKIYVFNKNTLINNTPDFDDKSWNLADVIVDIRNGTIRRIENTSLYRFYPSARFDIEQSVKIRYQLYKNRQIRSFVTELNFSNFDIEKNYKPKSSFVSLDFKLPIEDKTIKHEIKVENQTIATITYKFNLKDLHLEIKDFLFNLIIFNVVMFLPILFVIGFYHRFLFKKHVTNPVNNLNKYLDSVLDDKFSMLDKKEYEGTKEVQELSKKVSKISGKIASLKNELNINKETLELKASTDTLTGLPNKNIFDFDIKSMYVSGISGYVFILRIEKLTQISEKYDSSYINNFIQSYVSVVKRVMASIHKTNISLYRFYGSKFAIIAKNIDMEQSNKLCEDIIKELHINLKDIYEIPDDLVQIAGTFFDIYGSVDSLLKSTDKAYEISKKKGKNSYHIIAEEELEKNFTELDSSVVDIIERAEFNLDFVLDSYSFDQPDKVIMNEAAPQLYTRENEKLPIGSFISVAEKLQIAHKFDKLVIVKTIAHIRGNDLEHAVAINLSMSSINDQSFMTWLETVLQANKDILDKIVFSITSYTAYLNKETFVMFVRNIHDIGANIILKRYKTDEYPLEELEGLQIDYIRMHQDYTANFANDMVKKHKVKNILIFAELNGINVIADSVKLESDYDLLERLGTYATSR
ncbi:MAG: EAL domain-containing protein [Campylobacteraceae bacterium]|nr:EAL domain-containing protein [Campylobacteraceae bacterium]